MLKRKRRIRKRFYIILTFLAVILCISMAKILQGSFGNKLDALVKVQHNRFLDPTTAGKLIVCLDPGHGGHDNGTKSILGFIESDINLKVTLQVGKLLEKSDMEIVYTRTKDESKGPNQEEDLKARCDISNNAGADIFVSIHCNFDKTSSKSKGFEIWCTYPRQKGEDLAKFLDDSLDKIGYSRDRGLKYESEGSLYVLKNTRAVAALVELGFLSNQEDSSFLKSDEGQQKCSEAIAQGIKDFVGKED